jgi:hypothetical protein
MAYQSRKSRRESPLQEGSPKPQQAPNRLRLQVGENWPDGITAKVETIPAHETVRLGGVGVNTVAEGQPCEAVIERAVEVIGDRAQAMRWLGTPVRALNYATPISRLHEPQGQDDVLRVLVQLEHGVL